ncbi:glia maturation factor gamma [Monocercomonoides exilis]|uniref:glia maturation factor gamma n=1 Tax=Monocercomonoides exilis TaxID=2049356 RepID=UPI00355A35D4|nr:glia maturation factor gamma [Monocercomonoides exilis]|eukprot:MONOS_1774.1-p1 / transcript=MONOS_1774.1 / gene=MONOS_1774 / organism=Monocercomonoides_exilis_PA203 / gene_product=glia maturation factor gamma / transcript_product=glia maturation factor gamma / location=Mono_scaffold00033:63245-64063(-) / protein_length=148 / sequence_SO=supercontig / SO=protein_coding / is_pseudo=false
MSTIAKDSDSMGMTHTFEEGLLEKFNKFRLSNAPSAAMVLGINAETQCVHLLKQLDDVSYDDLIEEFPDAEPRFVIHSFRWERGDGRIQYPLILIYYSPYSVPAKQAMLYASAQGTITRYFKLNKTVELKDPEDLSLDWLKSQLSTLR